MIPAPDPAKLTAAEQLAADIAAWEASGKKVERLAIGECNEGKLTTRQRVNPQIIPAEVAAKKAQQGKTERPRPAPKPVKVGPKIGRDGTKTGTILAMLKDGPLTAREIAVIKGWRPILTAQALAGLRERGLVRNPKGKLRRPGQLPAMGWELVP